MFNDKLKQQQKKRWGAGFFHILLMSGFSMPIAIATNRDKRFHLA